MRILTVQNAVLVSLAAGVVALSACSSSDAVRPDASAGAPAGGGGNTTAGTTSTAGMTSTTAGSGNGGAAPMAGAGNTAGGGNTAGAAGAAGPSVCDGLGSRLLDATMAADAFIDDAELEQMTGADKPAGGWYGFNDVMPTGNAIQPKRVAGGAVTTGHAISYSGMGAKTPVMGGYGVGLEINVGIAKDLMPPQYCVDANAFKGVSFWAKAKGTNKTISVGFVVPSQNQVKNGGDCGDDLPAAKCNNYPQKNFTLTADWAQYTVDFAGLKGSTGALVVAGKVQQLLFLAPTADWDFSVDEIAFYATTPPAGAVAVPKAP